MWYISLCFCVLNLLSVGVPVRGFLVPINQWNELIGQPSPVGSIWPRPFLHTSNGTNYFAIDTQNFKIQVLDAKSKGKVVCLFLDWAQNHYQQLVQNLNQIKRRNQNQSYEKKEAQNVTNPSLLVVELFNCTDLSEDTQADYESYSLDSRGKLSLDGLPIIATMYANSAQGAIRGLESFYQMLWPNISANGDSFGYNINATYIVDLPRFVHRGLMLDTSRHFLTEKIILKILTGMMYNKLNVFHWHIIDDQSFPFESRVFPELSQKGAYHKNAVYSPETVQRIIEAARVRGIRTILEFDTPGHAGAIGKSHQELLTPCYGDENNPGTPGPGRFAAYENLDPSNEKVYKFTKLLFTEIVKNVTKDKYLHLGMDEVYPPCWESSPEIHKFMKENNYTKIYQVQEHYTSRHVAMVKGLGVKVISWQDPIDAGVQLDKDVVVHIWKDFGPWLENYLKILEKGYKVLFSTCWYMNYISYGETWRKYFECDPYLDGLVPSKYRNQVMGGEAAIWGEFVDPTNIIPRIFPFVGAIGSVLWDSRIDALEGRENTDDAMFRLDNFRCSLLQRGIEAQPIYNGGCGPYEYQAQN